MITDKDTNFVYFSKLIKERPVLKNFWCLFDKTLKKAGINYGFIDNTNDVWCRDYMPVQVTTDQFVQFKYYPSYCNTRKRRHLITDTDQVNVNLGYNTEIIPSPILLDGGNVVKSQNSAVLTDKIYSENEGDRDQISEHIKKLLKVDKLHIIPKQPNDYTGHSDGMVRLIDDNTLLVADYKSELPYWKTKYERALNQTGLKIINFPGVSSDIKNRDGDYTAIGCYINFAWIGNVILFPQFGLLEDEKALDVVKGIFRTYEVIPVPVRDLAMDGGVLNCVTWNVKLTQ